jgi:hypothetical protein
MPELYKILLLLYTFKDSLFVNPLQNAQQMKKRHIIHAHQQAKIYHNHYKPSLNIFRLLKSVLSIFITGSSPSATTYARRK